jgi:hypothetical protein
MGDSQASKATAPRTRGTAGQWGSRGQPLG